ncbi:RNA polymerase sigma factor (sigma-70 family) [Dysgonomonas sp. PFB1-18]|uniref:RNA polymerase sigma factor n=1 Tax=unclassified Dysgonomonas TaxID=2630389 RepID=UPI0024761E62|nr:MULTISPECIES: sigma-70 family RNA polymerase sigma factor [unclassified Dysgonomonas]MDL2303276.1 sigma-70 family RNA polymerase sigma factor [Dysgonomonas sp. OttesenSCG-928-D17]MDH6310379.1 RNA polymerase sigma factor (sigma-70 family) [Dysgonomonas sp. PF1-14]MDH6340291.1 RNA polymerase sigma factor (sigma-70 family) [Dysgonomonas sp. PF1-16]MDH6381929.1 RNA polymerase sigma factor (sigma-70 family) [Dysgonomonas sp. PFB1-18]MDH6399262.1 RNA polymerase sigma factor (sigma-70 family) [Dys
MDEKQQIHKVLKGDMSAFGYFVDTYQDMAITIAYRICGNKQDAEDIVQNAFVKAFHNLHTFRADSKFSTWFYRIVYNTAITETRTSTFNTEFVDYKVAETNSYSDMDTMSQIEENERNRLINEAMEQMPKDESVMLTLYYLEDNPVKEIALITNLTESNVKVKLHRARKRFADIIGNQLRV